MPAGNDTATHEAFRSSIESQFGPYQNAEELVRAHQASIDPGLRRAGITRVDVAATEKASKDMKATAGKFKGAPEGAELVSCAVRGNALVGVFETQEGHLVKLVTGANDSYESKMSPTDRAARAQAQADAEVARETARLRQETEQRLAEARAEEEERLQTELAKIRASAQEDVEKASGSDSEGDEGKKSSRKKGDDGDDSKKGS